MYSEHPLAFIEQHGPAKRVHDRDGQKERRFLHRDAERVLPLGYEGRLRLARWGGWVEEGKWAAREPEPVEIPATMGLEGGVWFKIQQGIRGVLVKDDGGNAAVYVVCEPASHYYEVMTRSKRMPVLIDERI